MCHEPAVSTLTFVYEDSTMVLGPLARTSEPAAYDMCSDHAARLTAPRGWEMIRVPGSADTVDDLVALAHAVNEPEPAPEPVSSPQQARSGGRPQLHLVRDADD